MCYWYNFTSLAAININLKVVPWIIAQSISPTSYKFYGNKTHWLQTAGCSGNHRMTVFGYWKCIHTHPKLGEIYYTEKYLNDFSIKTIRKKLKPVEGVNDRKFLPPSKLHVYYQLSRFNTSLISKPEWIFSCRWFLQGEEIKKFSFFQCCMQRRVERTAKTEK